MSHKPDSSRLVALAALMAAAAVAALGAPGCSSSADVSATGKKYEAVDEEGPSAAGGGPTQMQRGGEQAAAQSGFGPAAPGKPPVVAGDSLGSGSQPSYEIPAGTPEEILAFIQQLETIQPQGKTHEEAVAQFSRIQRARIEGCEKILASKTSDEIRITAVQTKVEALRMLDQTGAPGARQELADFAKSLQSDANPELARFGRLLTFGFHIDDFVSGRSDDFAALKQELTSLLADEGAHQQLADLGGQVASVLYGAGQKDHAGEVMRLIGEKLKHNSQTAEAAESLLSQAKMIELDFGSKMEAALSKEPDAVTNLIRAIKELAGADEPNETVYDITHRAGQNLEMGGNYDGAAQIYRLLSELFNNHSDAGLAESAAQQADQGLRRVGLVGKPFEVTGVTLDGKPFDWTKYKGKVVLVDFWATWCTPCLGEIPNIEKNYEAFHPKGFEVVGVNLDEDRTAVDRFLAQWSLPWTTVVSADPDAQGFDSPLAVQCGIDAIPFVVLVDRDGIAVALHVRGAELRQRLTDMLGSVDAGTGSTKPPGDEPTGPAVPGRDGADKTSRLGRRPPDAPAAETSVSLVAFADPAARGETGAAAQPEGSTAEVNPYGAPASWSPARLVDFLVQMQGKPRSIQRRDAFVDAMVEAADRILSADTSARCRRIAALAKFSVLHKKALSGDPDADKRLLQFVRQMKDEPDQRIAREVRFLRLEREVLDADQLPREKIPELLGRLKEFFAAEKLTERHLRMASSTVRLINRLDSDDQEQKEQYAQMREKYFAQFGELFAKSENPQLARYGRKLAQSSTPKPAHLLDRP